MSRLFFWKLVHFCPACGVRSVLRDYDNQGGDERDVSQVNGGTEWWCTTCGFHFKIGKSRKWYLADELVRRDRKERMGKPSDNTNHATRDAFVQFLERQKERGDADKA